MRYLSKNANRFLIWILAVLFGLSLPGCVAYGPAPAYGPPPSPTPTTTATPTPAATESPAPTASPGAG